MSPSPGFFGSEITVMARVEGQAVRASQSFPSVRIPLGSIPRIYSPKPQLASLHT